MAIKTLIKRSEYHDSVSLMLAARELAKVPGVADAAVVMATEANKSILRDAGLLTEEASAASSNDLVIAVRSQEGVAKPDEILEGALDEAVKLLAQQAGEIPGSSGGPQPKTIRSALRAFPSSNVALISVAGRYAAAEAWEALRQGLHVLLFSDNVSLEDERSLKEYARSKSLLLMGPGAGTSILNGAALGFANALPPGSVGIVSAAGTGLQEVSTLLARFGVGITQGIGVGGRDLNEAIGGAMMLSALEALQEDSATEVIVLISKPPAESVARRVLDQVRLSSKTAFVCFLGASQSEYLPFRERSNLFFASTLQEAALLAARAAGASLPDPDTYISAENQALDALAAPLRLQRKPDQGSIRALFSGGTLCYEAQVIWRDMLGDPVLSNAPLRQEERLPDSSRSQGHTALDLGEEGFTVGRPHPMIDNDLRIRRLLQEARDPTTAVILIDVVLGFGAHPDPAAELVPAIQQARSLAGEDGRELVIIASVTGTEDDPQVRTRQVKALESCGVLVCESNAAAARLAAKIVA